MEKYCIKKVKALCVQLFFYYFCRKTIIHLLMKNVMRFLSAFAALLFSSLYAVSQESAAFLEPTVVTVVEKTTGNDIKDGNKETAWSMDAGVGAQDIKNAYAFYSRNIISLKEPLEIGRYSSIEIQLGLGTYNGYDPVFSNLEVGIAYQSGDTVRSKTNIAEGDSRQEQKIVFDDLKQEQGEIYIKSISDKSVCTLLYDVAVCGVKAAPEALLTLDYSFVDIAVDTMDYWITSLYMPDRSNDTIYYNDFSEGDLKGIISLPENVMSYYDKFFFMQANSVASISAVVPVELNNVSGDSVEVKLSFKAGRDRSEASKVLNVYADNVLFGSFSDLPLLENTQEREGWKEYEVEFTTTKRRLDLTIAIEDPEGKQLKKDLLLDDICVRSGMYSYVEAEGYPVKVDGETYRFENLAPNTEMSMLCKG